MEKREMESSLIQYKGIVGKVKKLINIIAKNIFPKRKRLYVADEKNIIMPAMSPRQIAAVADKICKAAAKGFKGLD